MVIRDWSGRRDSNPRPQPWQGCALPLSYTRILPGSGLAAEGPSYASKRRPMQYRKTPIDCRSRAIPGWLSAPRSSTSFRVFPAPHPSPEPIIMPASPADLFAFLDRLGIAHPTVDHPPVFTVEESRELRGRIAGGHSKNLFLKDKKDSLFLVVASEDAVLDLKGLHRRLGASGRFSFGSAPLLMEALGVIPGAVTPFAAINDTAHRVDVVLEAAMMKNDIINFHPLDNAMTTSIGRDDLVRFLRATGHEPRIEALAEAEAAT
jgi:Ala-tRNA(Pro) deacylase